VHAQLTDGTEVLIRAIRPDDKALLVQGMHDLSPASRRARFLSAKPRLTTSELRYLTELDGLDHYALIAVRADDPSRLAGVARFIRSKDDPEAAEVAVTVGDPLQGKGLGRTLGLRLADAARARGVRRFTAVMLADNVPAHRLFRAISLRLDTAHAGGISELVADLAA
jgi:GNAT superfamily N-acetyltransferase